MPEDKHVDLISANGQLGQGNVAHHILNNGGLNVGSMRPFVENGNTFVTIYKGGRLEDKSSWVTMKLNTNGTLRRDEWKALDDVLIEVKRYRLGGIDDLISHGLTYNLGNAMGTTVLEWHDVSDSMEADVTMDGVTRSKGDRPVFQHNYLPIPIIHVDYEINARVLAASRNNGNPLDTTSAAHAARRVREKIENMLFTNTIYSFGEKDSRNTNTIFSYVNHPDRNIVPIGTHWDDLDFDSSTARGGEAIVDQVIAMKAVSLAARYYGPWRIYIPSGYETILDHDYDKTTPGKTIRERLLAIDGISGIKVIDTLAANNVLMVQMTPDVVRLIRGLDLQNVQWDTEGKFITKYKVLAIMVPQIRSDQEGHSGIVHMA